MSGHSCWHDLISWNIEHDDSGNFRFSSLSFETQQAPRGLKDRNIDGPFVARPQKVPHVCKDIVSTKTQAPHPKIAPVLSVASREDLNLLKCCKAHGLEDEAENAWAQENEDLEPTRCDRLGGTSHQACLEDSLGQRLRRPVCPSACFGLLLRSSRVVEADSCPISVSVGPVKKPTPVSLIASGTLALVRPSQARR